MTTVLSMIVLTLFSQAFLVKACYSTYVLVAVAVAAVGRLHSVSPLCCLQYGSLQYQGSLVTTKVGKEGHPTVVFLQIASGANSPSRDRSEQSFRNVQGSGSGVQGSGLVAASSRVPDMGLPARTTCK